MVEYSFQFHIASRTDKRAGEIGSLSPKIVTSQNHFITILDYLQLFTLFFTVK